MHQRARAYLAWHNVDGDPATTIIDYGRVVDLIVLGQPTENASPITREIADKMPLAAGRPVNPSGDTEPSIADRRITERLKT